MRVNVAISESLVAGYEHDGYVRVPDVLDGDQLERLRAIVDELTVDARAGASREAFVVLSNVCQHRPDLIALLSAASIGALASRLMRWPGARLIDDTVMNKEPGAGATPWHQDQPYYDIQDTPVCTIWLALDPADASRGALRYVSGSHRWGTSYAGPHSLVRDSRPATDRLPSIAELAPELERTAVTVEARPGDALIHHGLTIHGACANVSANSRRAFAVSLAGEHSTRRPASPSGARGAVSLDDERYPRID